MTNEDQNFVEEIQDLSKSDNKKVKENREAIRHLAKEIRKLKDEESKTESSDTALLEKKVDKLAHATRQLTGTVDTLVDEELLAPTEDQMEKKFEEAMERFEQKLEQLDQEKSEETDSGSDNYGDKESQDEYSCAVCGKTFDTERKRNGHEGGAHSKKERVRARSDSEEKVEIAGLKGKRALKIVERLYNSENDWLSSSKMAENIDLSSNEIKNAYPLLKKEGLVETNKVKGVTLTELGREYAREKAKNNNLEASEMFDCSLCDGSYRTSRGFASHLANAHQVTSKDVEEGQKVTQVYRRQNYSNENSGKVVAPESIDEEFPQFNQDEPVDPSHWNVKERMYLIKKVLEDSDKPLTRDELAKEIFNLDYEPKHGAKPYNVMMAPVSNLIEQGDVEEQERLDINGQRKAYGLVGSSPDSSSTEQETQEEEEEDSSTDLEYALEQNDISRREFRSYKNTFTKIIYQTDHDGEVNYYDFSQYWGGEQQGLDAWRTIYQSPTILNAIREEVCDHLSFSWTAKSGGRKPQNWTLNVSES